MSRGQLDYDNVQKRNGTVGWGKIVPAGTILKI
jgi:hypothetical protein